MLRLLVLVLGTVRALSGLNSPTDLNLTCYNDLIRFVSCEFEGQQCSQYNLSLTIQQYNERAGCDFKQRRNGQCCCSADMTLILGEIIRAEVSRGGKIVASKNIDVTHTVKPRVPTIISVQQSNANFQVKWKSNMESTVVDNKLEANVTYYKKGETRMVSKRIIPATKDEHKFHEIAGQDLEPSTTYVVFVRSYLPISDAYSDPSEELEFTTPMSYKVMPVVVVVVLSVLAVIVMGATYYCYSKIKATWWDAAVKSLNPKLLDIQASEQKLLKPALPYISSICIEHLIQDDDKSWSKGPPKDSSDGSSEGSSEVSSGSTLLSYANTAPVDIIASVQEALGHTFANISPNSFLGASPASEAPREGGPLSSPSGSASSSFDNKTYSILLPGLPLESPANGTAEIACDFGYRPSEGPAAPGPGQLPPAPLLLCGGPPASSLMTDMSYQQCSVEPHSFTQAQAPCVPSLSNATGSGDPVPGTEVGHSGGHGDLAAPLGGGAVMVSDENPCYGALPAASCGFLTVKDEYQAFQSLVGRPDAGPDAACPGGPSGGDPEQLSTSSFPPLLPLLPASPCTPLFTDSDYQSLLR